VLESTRAEEERVKRETKEGLATFRQRQEEADKKARIGSVAGPVVEEGSPIAEEESWIAGGRKRKRTKAKEGLKGVKLRRTSTADEKAKPAQMTSDTKPKESTRVESQASPEKAAQVLTPTPVARKATSTAKGSLVAYGSDSEDE